MPGVLQLVQVTKTPARIQSWLVTNEVVMLVNPDIQNNVYIGNDPGSQLIAIPALGSVTLNTEKHDLWISTNGGNYTVSAYLMPEGSNWVPSPAQVAASIGALGLATANNQAQQLTNDASVISNTGSTAANTAGVAKDTTLQTNVTNTANTATNTANTVSNTGATATNTAQTATNVSNLTIGGNPGGIPILRGTDNFGVGNAQNIPANSTVTLLAGTAVTKPGYEAVLQLNMPASSGTIPFATIQVLWQDSNTGLQVGQKSYVMPAGNGPANVITCYLSGPCRGNVIVFKIINNDPSVAMSLTWAFNQTAHIYSVDRYLQATYPANPPNGQSQGGGNPSKGLLFASQPAIGAGAGTTITRMTAASNAKANLNIDLGGGLQVNVTLSTPSTAKLYDEATANQSIMGVNTPTGARSITEIQMPGGPLNVNMVNQLSTAATPSVIITLKDY